ncbi:50S ribosomal protein L21 [bacterium]|nr:50S ribosomal protein L21 [bacterium]
MQAVIATGGKQYTVQKDAVLKVEKLAGDVGAKVKLDQVLAVINGDKVNVGAPLVSGATVEAEILKQGKGDKVLIFKKKRRQNYRRKNGHRQLFTAIKITNINA